MLLDYLFLDGLVELELYCNRYGLDPIHFARAIRVIQMKVRDAKRA